MYWLTERDAGEVQTELDLKFESLFFSELHSLQSALAHSQNEHSGDSKARSPVLQIVWDVKAEVL